MTVSRWLAGLAALITAMLLQATLIGPLLTPLPASLPLVVIACIALLTGPSTGITLGFAGGLLVDLGSEHPVGILAFTWLLVGLAAGVLGGLVVPAEPVRNAGRRQRASDVRRRLRKQRVGQRRPQALLVGGLAGLGAAVTGIALALVDAGVDHLDVVLVRCGPAAVLDAILALMILPGLRAAIESSTLRAPIPPTHQSAPSLQDAR